MASSRPSDSAHEPFTVAGLSPPLDCAAAFTVSVKSWFEQPARGMTKAASARANPLRMVIGLSPTSGRSGRTRRQPVVPQRLADLVEGVEPRVGQLPGKLRVRRAAGQVPEERGFQVLDFVFPGDHRVFAGDG